MQTQNMMSGVVDATLLSALQIGREKHWFQSQFQAVSVFYKFCQAGDIFSFDFHNHLLDQ